MRLRLTLGDDAAEWAILGNYRDCRERLERCCQESGLTHVAGQFHNLPEDLSARAATVRRRNRDDRWRVDGGFIPHPSNPTRTPGQ
jgi:hypothetical protein